MVKKALRSLGPDARAESSGVPGVDVTQAMPTEKSRCILSGGGMVFIIVSVTMIREWIMHPAVSSVFANRVRYLQAWVLDFEITSTGLTQHWKKTAMPPEHLRAKCEIVSLCCSCYVGWMPLLFGSLTLFLLLLSPTQRFLETPVVLVGQHVGPVVALDSKRLDHTGGI